MSHFWVTAQFLEKCTKRPQMTWHVQGQKYQHACYIHPPTPRPKFSSVSLYDNFRKRTEWPQMTLTCSRSKIPTCMTCMLHTPWMPNFHLFRSTMSCFRVTAQFWEKCTEWPQMILTCSRSKIPTWMLHTALSPRFSSVSLYGEPFSSSGPIFRKVHWMTQNDLDIIFKVKGTYGYYMHHWGPNFCPFRCTMSCFWGNWHF